MKTTMRPERPVMATILTRAALVAAAGMALVLPATVGAAGSVGGAPAALVQQDDGRTTGHGPVIEAVTDLLGLSPKQVGDRLRGGESLAQIAADEGVSDAELTATIEGAIADLLDQGVAAGRLTATQHDALAKIVAVRVDELIERTTANFHEARPQPPVVVGAVADLLGLEPRKLVERVRGGESLAEVAEAEGVAEAEVVAVIERAALAKLAEVAATADLSEAEEAALEELVAVHVEHVTEMEPGDFSGLHGDMFGHDGS